MSLEEIKNYDDKKLKETLEKFTKIDWVDKYISAFKSNSIEQFKEEFETWTLLIKESKERIEDHTEEQQRMPIRQAEAKHMATIDVIKHMSSAYHYAL